MKILVISDTHLNKRFEPKKFDLLKKLISDADKVIINGDFWDHWYQTFDQFLNTKWKELFPLLKAKNTVYLHGNHDPKHKCSAEISLFCDQSFDFYEEVIDGIKFSFCHGHTYVKKRRSPLIEFWGSLMDQLETVQFSKYFFYAIQYTERALMKVFGPDFITNSNIATNNNVIIKNNKTMENWLVCGHSHGAEMDLIKKYINTGCIINHTISYVTIENGIPQLYKAKY